MNRNFLQLISGLVIAVIASAIPAPTASAQESEEEERIVVRERQVIDQEERLKAAEARLEEAAREIAEITSRMVPGAVEYAKRVLIERRRPVLGVSIGGSGDDEQGPVDGVAVLGVTPGSPAEEAGIRSGDVLTRIGDESLAADSALAATERLLEALGKREPGETIALGLLRDGEKLEVEVATRDADLQSFAFLGDHDLDFEFDGDAPIFWVGSSRPWGDMELVEMTPQLGRYFGTDKGLLVVRAPADPALKLEDGDVIRSIGGREPHSVSHAMRILRSYTEGEDLELEIMRDKRSRKLAVEIPASRGALSPPTTRRFLPRAPLKPPAQTVDSGPAEV